MRMTPQDYAAYVARNLARNARGASKLGADSQCPTGQERTLQGQIRDECTRRGWIYFTGSMVKRTFRTLGEPDFTIIASEGRTYMIECKTKTGKLTLEQLALAKQASVLGHTIHVVRSFVEFIQLVDKISVAHHD